MTKFHFSSICDNLECWEVGSRAGPQTEKWENLNGTKFFLLSLTIKMTWKKFGSLEINFSWWDLKLKKMARAQGKMR